MAKKGAPWGKPHLHRYHQTPDLRVMGGRVLQARLARGLTQADVVKDLGRSASWLSLIEHNAMMPSIYSLVALCYVLDVNVGWLLLGEGVGDGNTHQSVRSRRRDKRAPV